MKKRGLIGLLLLCLFLTACRQNPSEEQLFSKLTAYFTGLGYSCERARLTDVDPQREAPIYKASAWHVLSLNGEEVLAYFDESNRADYLSEGIDAERWGCVNRFGLRFILVYEGQDEGVIHAIQAIEND